MNKVMDKESTRMIRALIGVCEELSKDQIQIEKDPDKDYYFEIIWDRDNVKCILIINQITNDSFCFFESVLGVMPVAKGNIETDYSEGWIEFDENGEIRFNENADYESLRISAELWVKEINLIDRS